MNESAAEVQFTRKEDLQSYLDCYIDNGYNESDYRRPKQIEVWTESHLDNDDENENVSKYYRRWKNTSLIYSKERSMVLHKGRLIKQYSYVDLIDIRNFL